MAVSQQDYTTHVRQETKNYLKKLHALGADSFRLDAAKHIEPDFCREVLKVVPPDKFVYGEVIGQTIEESNEYTRIFSVTDLHLLNTMSNAFSVGGGTKQRGGIQLGPRDVLFFVQTSTTECK